MLLLICWWEVELDTCGLGCFCDSCWMMLWLVHNHSNCESLVWPVNDEKILLDLEKLQFLVHLTGTLWKRWISLYYSIVLFLCPRAVRLLLTRSAHDVVSYLVRCYFCLLLWLPEKSKAFISGNVDGYLLSHQLCQNFCIDTDHEITINFLSSSSRCIEV